MHGLDRKGKPAQEYRCTVATCKRHRRGFRRQWNLIEHQRRIHGSVTSGSSSPGALLDEPDLIEAGSDSSTSPFVPTELLSTNLDPSTNDLHDLRQRGHAKVEELQRQILRLSEGVVRRKETLAVVQDILKGI